MYEYIRHQPVCLRVAVGSSIAGCQQSHRANYSMGYVQGRPQIESGGGDGGEIVLQYLNGEPCHVGRENESGRSTTIHFRCSGYEQGPKFFYETAYCDYIFTWDTPSACATNVSALSMDGARY